MIFNLKSFKVTAQILILDNYFNNKHLLIITVCVYLLAIVCKIVVNVLFLEVNVHNYAVKIVLNCRINIEVK